MNAQFLTAAMPTKPVPQQTDTAKPNADTTNNEESPNLRPSNSSLFSVIRHTRTRLPSTHTLAAARDRVQGVAVVASRGYGRYSSAFTFKRPNDDQRRRVLTEMFNGAGISSCAVDKIVSLLGPTDHRPYGVTYSDLRQRFVPDARL